MIRRWLSRLLRRQPRKLWALQVPPAWSAGPAYWTGTAQGFSTDLRRAVLFTSREDAERVLAEQDVLEATAVAVDWPAR